METDIKRLEEITSTLGAIIDTIEEFHSEGPVVKESTLLYIESEAKFIRKFLIVALILLSINLVLEVTQFFV